MLHTYIQIQIHIFHYKSDEKMRVWGSSIEGNNFLGVRVELALCRHFLGTQRRFISYR